MWTQVEPAEGPARAAAALRLLTFTTLYPNAEQPNHGVFVENRLRHLVSTGQATSHVLAPVPFFPAAIAGLLPSRTWSRMARVPEREVRHGLNVDHPRYVAIPRFGMSAAPFLLHQAASAAFRRLAADGLDVELIDAHYVYPDGVAAVRLAHTRRLPVVITARGSDVTQLPDFALPRRWIRWAIARADGLIAVSNALAERLVSLGARPERVRVLRNGVDLELFRPPADRARARRALQLEGPTLLSVGHLIERKGHHRTIEAVAALPETTLLIAGEGPMLASLRALAERLGVSGRVRFLGACPHGELPSLYGAADASVLASSREGWANVLLESMACGTPVVASPIPGNDEVVRAAEGGLIAPANTAGGLAEGIRTLLKRPPERGATRRYAELFGWESTSRGQMEVFRRVLAGQ